MSNSTVSSHTPFLTQHSRPAAARAVILWLAIILLMVAGIVLVGGLTRLTESGLSITEWKPINGIIPPLSEADWQAEFDKYQATTQYHVLNQGMTVGAFKAIYWWEWGHRLLARTIGLVVLIPLLAFWWLGTVRGGELRRGVILFGLICLQGLVGWLMVKTGLAGRTAVTQYSLATHLVIAFFIFAWTLRMLLMRLSPRLTHARQPGYRLALGLFLLVYLQILFGALVAGTNAGLVDNTWPLMEGGLVPNGLMIHQPWWSNFGDNPITVQFQHRLTAYLVLATALVAAVRAVRLKSGSGSALAVLAIALGQATLGILTLLGGADGVQPIGLSAAHQFGALCLFAAAATHLFLRSGPESLPRHS